MCFSPQRRAIFEHLNFKKCSEPLSFLAFSLQNVLLATAACNFSTSQLQKVVRSWCVLYIFTSKCASRHSGVQFLISPLTTWLRIRRFNEPTFRLTRHTNHWKNTAFRDFSNIWRGCIFFLLTFALLHLLSSDSTSSSDFTSSICFSTLHIVGSLLFKLPSIIEYLLYVRQAAPSHRQHLSNLWIETIHVKWGPFFRLRQAARSFSFTFEDPFVLLLHGEAHSVDEPLDSLKHLIRDSYRQALLSQASTRRQDCQGSTHPIHVELTRAHYFSLTQPLHQTLLRQILTGAIDHRSRLFKSNLTNSPLCPFCNIVDETAQHIFWDCTRWQTIRSKFPILLRLFHLVGSQWPNCFLHCGWLEQGRNYGLPFLIVYNLPTITTLSQGIPIKCTFRLYFVDMKPLRYSNLLLLLHQIYTSPSLSLLLLSHSNLYSSKEKFHPFQFALRSLVKTTPRWSAAKCQKIYIYIKCPVFV